MPNSQLAQTVLLPDTARMGLPLLSNCCCGCTLKTGTVIIGAINLVSSVIVMITAIILMISPDAIMSYLDTVVPGWKEDIDTSSMRIGQSGTMHG